MKLPPCSSQLRSHSRTGHDSASGSGVIGVKELIRNSLTRGPETARNETSLYRNVRETPIGPSSEPAGLRPTSQLVTANRVASSVSRATRTRIEWRGASYE